jgi:HEAT repeat protein
MGRAGLQLAQCILDGRFSIDFRLYALELLARRPHAAGILLPRLLQVKRLPDLLHAAIILKLARTGSLRAATLIGNLTLAEDVALIVRHSALVGLGQLARNATTHTPAVGSLLAFLQSGSIDDELIITAIFALGRSNAAATVPAVAVLLAPTLTEQLHDAWNRQAPILAHIQVEQWLATEHLPTAARMILARILAAGTTVADRPGNLAELVQYQRERIGLAAIEVLLNLVKTGGISRHHLPAILRRGLLPDATPAFSRTLVEAVQCCAEADDITALSELAEDRQLALEQRMLAFERLGMVAPVALLNIRLMAAFDDPLMQVALIDSIGQRCDPDFIPILRQIAEQRGGPIHARCAAATALGRIPDTTAQAALTRLLTDHTSPEALRFAVAEALPRDLEPITRQALRTLLGSTTNAPRLTSAVAAALGRCRDRGALPLLLRQMQDEHVLVAVAAIEAIAAIGDGSVGPNLVGIAQYGRAGAGIRLTAVAALLQLCGNEYLPLLNEFLRSPLLPLRLEAHRILANVDPENDLLTQPLADRTVPLLLRLWSLDLVAAQGNADPTVQAIAADPDEDLQVRLVAATWLKQSSHPDTIGVLESIIASAPPILAQRLIEILVQHQQASTSTAEHARQALLRITTNAPATIPGFLAARAIVASM